MSDKLLNEFLKEELNSYTRSILLAAIGSNLGSNVEQYFTFNRFNVRLEFEMSRVTIEDELDPEREYLMEIPSFAASIEAQTDCSG